MSSVVIAGDTSGTVTLQAPAIAGTTTLNLPATSGTIVTGPGGVADVSSGGTGASSLSANAVILGNGTSAVQTVAPSTSGNVLTSNGTTWTSAAAPAGGFGNMQVFTSSGTFTVPSGITKVKVTVVGGGGNGSSNSTSTLGVGGGGGGAAIKIISGLTPGGTVSVTVGAATGTSSFGAYCSATGGATGNNTKYLQSNSYANGGVGSGGDLNIQGSAGSRLSIDASNVSGNGGNSIFGGGGAAGYNHAGQTAGQNGGAYGGGGGAGMSSSATAASGGTGASGVVIVEY